MKKSGINFFAYEINSMDLEKFRDKHYDESQDNTWPHSLKMLFYTLVLIGVVILACFSIVKGAQIATMRIVHGMTLTILK